MATSSWYPTPPTSYRPAPSTQPYPQQHHSLHPNSVYPTAAALTTYVRPSPYPLAIANNTTPRVPGVHPTAATITAPCRCCCCIDNTTSTGGILPHPPQSYRSTSIRSRSTVGNIGTSALGHTNSQHQQHSRQAINQQVKQSNHYHHHNHHHQHNQSIASSKHHHHHHHQQHTPTVRDCVKSKPKTNFTNILTTCNCVTCVPATTLQTSTAAAAAAPPPQSSCLLSSYFTASAAAAPPRSVLSARLKKVTSCVTPSTATTSCKHNPSPKALLADPPTIARSQTSGCHQHPKPRATYTITVDAVYSPAMNLGNHSQHTTAATHSSRKHSSNYASNLAPKFKYSVIDFSGANNARTASMPILPSPGAAAVATTTAGYYPAMVPPTMATSPMLAGNGTTTTTNNNNNNSHVPTTVGDLIMLIPRHHIGSAVSQPATNVMAPRMYPTSHRASNGTTTTDTMNGHYENQHSQLCCPSPSAIVAALSSIPTPILDQDDTYVCSVSSPRCFIIQKVVKPTQLESNASASASANTNSSTHNGGGGTSSSIDSNASQTTTPPMYAETSASGNHSQHHTHHYHQTHHHQHHNAGLVNGNGTSYKPPPLLGTAPRMPSHGYYVPQHNNHHHYHHGRNRGHSNHGSAQPITTDPNPTTNINGGTKTTNGSSTIMMNGNAKQKEKVAGKRTKSEDDDEGEEEEKQPPEENQANDEDDDTDDELYAVINRDRTKVNGTSTQAKEMSNDTDVVANDNNNDNSNAAAPVVDAYNRLEVDEGISEDEEHDEEEDDEEDEFESSTMSSNSAVGSAHSSPKRSQQEQDEQQQQQQPTTNGNDNDEEDMDDAHHNHRSDTKTPEHHDTVAIAEAAEEKVDEEAAHPVATEKQPNEEVIIADRCIEEDKDDDDDESNNNHDVCDLEPDVDVVDDAAAQEQASLEQANNDQNLIDTTGEAKATGEGEEEQDNKEVEEEGGKQQGEAVEANIVVATTGTSPVAAAAAAAAAVVPTAAGGEERTEENTENKGGSDQEKDENSCCGSLEQDIEKELDTTAKTKMDDYYQQQLEQHMATMGIDEQQNANNEVVYAENSYDVDDTTPMEPSPANPRGLSMKDLRAALKYQLEYYFSQQNLAKDSYLKAQMDKDHYVPIVTIANFEKIKHLTNDYLLVVDVLRSSTEVQVDDAGELVRPASYRNVVILRDVPPEISEEEIENLFKSEACPVKLVKYEKAANTASWYLYFGEADEAQKAIFYLKEELVNYPGTEQPILARMKAKPLVTSGHYRAQGANAPNPAVLVAGNFVQPQHGMPHMVASPVGSNNSAAVSPVSAMPTAANAVGAPVITGAGQPGAAAGPAMLMPAHNNNYNPMAGTNLMQSQLYPNGGPLLMHDPSVSGGVAPPPPPPPPASNGQIPYSAAGPPLFATGAPYPANVPYNNRMYPPPGSFYGPQMLPMPPNGGGGGVQAASPAAGQSQQPPPPAGSSPTFDLSTVFVMNGLIPHSYSNVTTASVMPPMQLPQPLTVGAGGSTTPTSTTPQPGVTLTPAPGQCSPTIQTPPSGIMPPGDYCHPMMMPTPHLGQMYPPGAVPPPHALSSAMNARYGLMNYPPQNAPVGQPQAAMSYAPSMSQMAAASAAAAGMYHSGVVVSNKPHHDRGGGGGGGRRNDERGGGGGGYRNGGGGRRNHGPGGSYYPGYYQGGGGQHSHNNSSGGGDRGGEKGYYNNGGGYREPRNGGHNRASVYYETNNAYGFRVPHNDQYPIPGNHGAPLISQPPINIVPLSAPINTMAAMPPAGPYDQQGPNNSGAGPRNRDTPTSYPVPIPPSASGVSSNPTTGGTAANYSNASSPMHTPHGSNSDFGQQQHHEGGGHDSTNNNNGGHSRPSNRARGSAGDANAAGNMGLSTTSSTSSLSQASSTTGSFRRPKHFPNYVPTKDGSGVMILPDDSPNGQSVEQYPIKHKFERANGGGRNPGMSPSSASGPSLASTSVHPRSNSAGSTTLGLGPNSMPMSRSSGSFSQRSNSRLGHHNQQHHNVHTPSASNPMTPEDPDFNLLANAFPPLPGTVVAEETGDNSKTNSGEASKKNTNDNNTSENEIVRPNELMIAPFYTSGGDPSRCLSPQSLADVVKGNVHHHHHNHQQQQHQQPQQSSKTSQNQSNRNSSANIEAVQETEPETGEASTSQLPTSSASSSVAKSVPSQQQAAAGQTKRPSSAAGAAAVVFATTDGPTSMAASVISKSKSVASTPTHQVHGKPTSNGAAPQPSVNGNDAAAAVDHPVEHVNGGGHSDSPDSADNLSSSSSVTSNTGGRLTYSQIAQKKEAQQQLLNNSNYQLPPQQHQSHQANLVAMATVAANATGVNQQQQHHNSNLVMFPHLLTNNHHHHLHLGGEQAPQPNHLATLNHPHHQAPSSHAGSNSLASSPIPSVKDGSTRPRSVVK